MICVPFNLNILLGAEISPINVKTFEIGDEYEDELINAWEYDVPRLKETYLSVVTGAATYHAPLLAPGLNSAYSATLVSPSVFRKAELNVTLSVAEKFIDPVTRVSSTASKFK